MAWLNLPMPNQTVKNGLKAMKIKLPQMNFFLKKQLIKVSRTYFIGQILKKFFQQIQSYEHAQLLGPKWPIFPNKYFFSENLLMSLISFIHAYLHAKNQSPDINLLLKY